VSPFELSVVFSLGLVSGLHCIQMCGPIVLAYSLPLKMGRIRAHLSYNAGRILTYMFLGALAGAAGGALGLVGRLAGIATGARIVSGAAMIVAAALMVGLLPSNGLIQINQPNRFSRAVARLLTSPGSKFSLGLTLGFLPCGLIYAALLKAMEAASAIAGALTMLAFGAGTAVALLAIGSASTFFSPKLGRWSTRLAPGFIALTGLVLLYRGLAAPHCHG
jgi:sulfite exporter TauE/SafE